jgi:hypothetical protein
MKENTKRTLEERVVAILKALAIGFAIILVVCPWFEIFAGILILLTAICCTGCRMVAWKFDNVHPSFNKYLLWSVLIGVSIAGLPLMARNHIIGWYILFVTLMIGLLIWCMVSARFSFLALRRYFFVPVVCVLVSPIIEFYAFVSVSDISLIDDYTSVSFLFSLMTWYGLCLAILSAVSLFAIVQSSQKKVDRSGTSAESQ